jgi:HSP20 family protein
MNLTRWNKNNLWDPTREFDRLQSEINKLFNYDYPDNSGIFDRHVNPAVDIMESGDDFRISFDLPGIDREDIDVSIAGNVLTVKGEKKADKKNEKSKVYRTESWSGSFQRTLSLPESIDPEKVSAEMKNGVLTIVAVKREEVKPKQITVNVD